ncbi:MAG TPA: hypothetical protein PKB01_07465 [Xanthobacteraceae bacterium]|nr:hypothetical protein [Xanthobacteraceae bacterium]
MLRDPDGRFTLGPTRDWALHAKPDGTADLECLFAACEGIPSSVRRQFCTLSAEKTAAPDTAPDATLAAFSRTDFERAAARFLTRNPELRLSVSTEPESVRLALVPWVRASLLGSISPGHTVEGTILMTKRGAVLLTLTCAFAERRWTEFGPKLEALAGTLTWTPKPPK